MKRLISALALVLVTAFTGAACGTNDSGTSSDSNTGSDSSSSPRSSDFNEADVTFAQAMIPHHRQAVVMARMARRHAATEQVRMLADQIRAAQGPEIAIMSGWLEDWGRRAPTGGMSGMGHGMGSMDPDDMPGMMNDDEVDDLDAATGAAFDRMWLTMMIRHHAGAVAMAKREQVKGTNADAIALAKKIETDQTAEIATMKAMLRGS